MRRVTRPDLGGRFHRHRILQPPRAQARAKIMIVAVGRIGNHWQTGHIPLQHLIHQIQRQLVFAPVNDLIGNLALGPPCRGVQPGLGQVKPPPQRTTRLTGAPMQTDRHLTIGDFAQSSTILPSHAHGSVSRFGKGSFVNHPHFRLGQQIHHLLRQLLLDLFHRPGTLTDKLAQGLNIRASNSPGQWFNGLATTLHEQSLQIHLGPMMAFTAAERSG